MCPDLTFQQRTEAMRQGGEAMRQGGDRAASWPCRRGAAAGGASWSFSPFP